MCSLHLMSQEPLQLDRFYLEFWQLSKAVWLIDVITIYMKIITTKKDVLQGWPTDLPSTSDAYDAILPDVNPLKDRQAYKVNRLYRLNLVLP